jgi:hypothetical protein
MLQICFSAQHASSIPPSIPLFLLVLSGKNLDVFVFSLASLIDPMNLLAFACFGDFCRYSGLVLTAGLGLVEAGVYCRWPELLAQVLDCLLVVGKSVLLLVNHRHGVSESGSLMSECCSGFIYLFWMLLAAQS